MGMNLAALGSLAGTVTSWFGNGLATWQANKGWRGAMERAEDRLNSIRQRKLDAAAHRDKVYYQDPTQTAENQAATTQAQQLLDEQAQRSKAGKTVSGATDESVALQKQANAASVGNMIQQQAIEGANKKDRYWNEWQAQDNGLENEADLWTRYLADTEKAKYLSRAQSIQNTANKVGASMVDFGEKYQGG